MKTIVFHCPLGSWFPGFESALGADRVADPCSIPCTVIADSANVRPRTPLFVPDFAGEWRLRVAVAAVVGRLGKSIEPRFAYRYVAGVRFVAMLMPGADVSASGIAASFDGALALGPELETDEADCPSVDVVHPSLPAGRANVALPPLRPLFDSAIALASRYMTLKTGDLIIPGFLEPEVSPEQDTRLMVSRADINVLDLKIK